MTEGYAIYHCSVWRVWPVVWPVVTVLVPLSADNADPLDDELARDLNIITAEMVGAINLDGPDDTNPTITTDPDEDGCCFVAQLTYEGVIIDLVDAEGDAIDSFCQTYEEILP